jgi:long-chain acyl-CoA synthetase
MATKKPTIIDFVEKYTRKFADNTYLREKQNGVWVETTFKQTRDEGRILAAGFMALGLQKGERVSLLAEARNLWVMTELGILYAGGVNVPLSYKLESDKDLSFRINHSDSVYIAASENEIPKIRRIIKQCPQVRKVIVFDDIPLEKGEMHISELHDMGVKFLKEHGEELEERIKSIKPDDYANISYTSGTTADPKGILLTHRNYTANVEQGNSVISVDFGATMLIILPLDHCFAHVAGMYTMMIYGGSIGFVPIGKNALATLKNVPTAISELRPHVMLSVPALARNFKKNIEAGIKKQGPMAEKLFNFAVHNAIKYNKEYYNRGTGFTFWRKPLMSLFDKILFSKVRESFGGRMQFFVGGGALLDIELQRFFCAVGMPMFQGYGLTEATPIICANSAGHARFGSSGRLVKPMDCVILDAEGKEVPHGTRGEIVIRGENVMAGYWKNPKATADTIVDGWLHTGDMGYICPEDPSFLYVVGRFKSLLISSDGEKYSPEGFEDNLTETSKWVNACVLHNNQKPFCVALVVPDKTALAEACSAHGLEPASEEGKRYMLGLIQADVDSYKKGGKHEGMFPERWLPSAVGICDEEFTIANKMMNSTMKIVRGKVEEHYASLLDYLYTAEGKDIHNERNLKALEP